MNRASNSSIRSSTHRELAIKIAQKQPLELHRISCLPSSAHTLFRQRYMRLSMRMITQATLCLCRSALVRASRCNQWNPMLIPLRKRFVTSRLCALGPRAHNRARRTEARNCDGCFSFLLRITSAKDNIIYETEKFGYKEKVHQEQEMNLRANSGLHMKLQFWKTRGLQFCQL